MTKSVQILLTKELTVNLGKDKDGQQKSVTLPAGLQEVDAEIAEHWFVKAHAQEITASATANKELQEAFDDLKEKYDALQIQSNAASEEIAKLQKELKDRNIKISDLEAQFVKQAQTQSAVSDKSKDQPKAK
ncbi:STY1053 family phage-associated protein [Acinetobacter bereziniae]|uniref:STY1053 family phage-associated protein n=1 Tax=Acinetobacter bereziniae TaxID=106648 RepID=UPI001250160A|nr:hypothetical protein [Acinetobacter bereziniae]